MRSASNTFDLIVIGSGIGGLTTASAMAQMKQMRVLVLERHFKLGGFTHTFTRPGNRSWDVGLHYVGEMGAGTTGRQLFDFITQGGVEWNKMPSTFEKFVYPDFTFEVPDNQAAYSQALVERFPDERAAIDQYFNDIHAARRWFNAQVSAQSFPRSIGSLIRAATRRLAKLALGTTREYLNQRFRSARLRAVLASQWGCYGLPPAESAFVIHAVIVSHYLDGGYYPVGGSGTIARSIAPIIEAPGGRCLVNHTVTEILVRGGRPTGVTAQAKKGCETTEAEFFAPVIVSDAGAYATFCRLLPESVPIRFRAHLERMAVGHGLVSLYLGFKDDPRKLGFCGENHWIYSSYDHDELFQRPECHFGRQPGLLFRLVSFTQGPKSYGSHRRDSRPSRLREGGTLDRPPVAQAWPRL